MKLDVSFKKYLLICALGFGLGGLLWGLVLYQELPQLEYCFHYLAIIIMAFFSGLSLAGPSQNLRLIIKAVLVNFLGWLTGFLISPLLLYVFFNTGIMLLSFVPLSFISTETLNHYLNLEPNIEIGDFWTIFLVMGAIIGFCFALFFQLKKKALVYRTGLGSGLGSLLGPVTGNLLGNLFNSVLLGYLMTFFVMSAVLGLFMGWAVYQGQRK